MQNKFKEGDTVYAKAFPGVKLMIRRYVHRIYYCRDQENSANREMAYFERELMLKEEAQLSYHKFLSAKGGT
jgi:hypothetical protein